MGLRGINYIYSGILKLDTGNMPVYYDFNNFSDEFYTQLVTQSGSPLITQDSSFIALEGVDVSGYNSVNFASFFIGQDINILSSNYASIIGNVDSFTGNGNSGNFNYGYLEINNQQDLFSRDFTVLLSQDKRYTGDGVLFSCFDDNVIKSGYSFGINSANKMYFEYFDNQNQRYDIQTSLLQLSDKNLIGLRKFDDSIYFLAYNNSTKSFESEIKSVISDEILPCNKFLIGSGQNQKSYSGFMDDFVYLNQNISTVDANILASGFWSDTKSGIPFLIESGITGGVSGYEYNLTGVTGILSTNSILTGTGYTTGYSDIYQYVVETGVVASGEEKIEFLQNLPQYCVGNEEVPIYRKVATLDSTGVIGLIRQFSGTDEVINGTDIYQNINNTGFLSSGLRATTIFNTGNNDISGLKNVMSGDRRRLSEYGMSEITYLGEYFDQSFGQEQTGINSFNSLALYEKEDDYSNEFRNFNFLNKTSLASLDGTGFSINQEYDGSEFRVSSNGLLRFSNSTITSAGLENFYKSGSIELGKVILSGNNTGSKVFYDANDFAVKSVFSGSNNISVHDNLFFKKGYKLASGLDYTGDAISNSFTAIKASDSTKEILAIGFRVQSGQHQSNVIPSSGKFFRDSSTNYFGRLRLRRDLYLETSESSDLTSNKKQLIPSGVKSLFVNRNYQSELSTGLVYRSYLTGASGFFNL
jgi:hypothetical protein|tara:strand:- start:2593 stop:4689 length:2097 start_codon:yes stop_codon:yes gene_type:complete